MPIRLSCELSEVNKRGVFLLFPYHYLRKRILRIQTNIFNAHKFYRLKWNTFHFQKADKSSRHKSISKGSWISYCRRKKSILSDKFLQFFNVSRSNWPNQTNIYWILHIEWKSNHSVTFGLQKILIFEISSLSFSLFPNVRKKKTRIKTVLCHIHKPFFFFYIPAKICSHMKRVD